MIILLVQMSYSLSPMNTLQEIILSMSKEELRFFKLYASRTNSNKTRKDILLFDQIKKTDQFSESNFQQKHYDQNKNAFYRLKNRLLEDINKSLTLQYLDEEADLSLMKNIILSRIFHTKGKHIIALDYLKKAEKKAAQIEAYEILNIIYFISFHHLFCLFFITFPFLGIIHFVLAIPHSSVTLFLLIIIGRNK